MDNQLVIRAHPFASHSGVLSVQSGHSLEKMLRDAAGGAQLRETLRVEIGGTEVPRAMWARLRPKPGTSIYVTGMPADSGASNNKTMRTLLMVVVMVAAIYLGNAYGVQAGAAWGMSAANAGMLIQSGVMMVGDLRMRALVPGAEA